jgi:hypothetical protein
MPSISSIGASIKRLASNPSTVLLGSFGIFLSTFGMVDFNRQISESETTDFQIRPSTHLGESLEQLHSSAFRESMTFDNIRANRLRCKELYFLFKRAELKKAEFKADVEFKDKSDADIESIVASEFYAFGQRMCRRAMIRHFHFIKWFKATMQDEFIKFYVLPVAGFFGARYFKLLDRTNGGKRNE